MVLVHLFVAFTILFSSVLSHHRAPSGRTPVAVWRTVTITSHAPDQTSTGTGGELLNDVVSNVDSYQSPTTTSDQSNAVLPTPIAPSSTTGQHSSMALPPPSSGSSSSSSKQVFAHLLVFHPPQTPQIYLPKSTDSISADW